MRAAATCSARRWSTSRSMTRVLADMALDVAAATALSFRLGRGLRHGAASAPTMRPMRR